MGAWREGAAGSVLRAAGPVWVGIVLWLTAAGCATVATAPGQQVYSAPKLGIDRFVQARGHTIHYVEAGEGRPLLLVPGAFTTYRAWDRVLPALSSRYRVLAVDYVGVGDSDKPEAGFRYTVEEQADVLADMIAGLDLGRASVAGASYGAAVALNLAARYPDRVGDVVCIEGGALIVPDVLNYSRWGAVVDWPVLGEITWAFMQSGLFDRVTARSLMGRAWDTLTDDERREIVDIVAANVRTVSKRSWMGIYRAITERIDFMNALAGARTRILYLYGAESKYRGVAEMNARYLGAQGPNVEIVRFATGIHDLHLQYPHAVSALVLRFLAEAEQGVVTADMSDPADDGIAAEVVVR